MPFPISVVGVVGVVGVTTVVGVTAAALHSDHSDHRDYSDYSDAEERRRRAEEARERERRANLEKAREEMRETLKNAMLLMHQEARNAGIDPNIIPNWLPGNPHFNYKDFSQDYARLDSSVKSAIRQAVDKTLEAEIAQQKQELDAINALVRRINERRLQGK